MDYKKINKELWNARTKVHVTSDFYDVKGFLVGNNPLNKIELDLLGDLKGKKILHLQCHFGMDTLALARLGADVTGVDLSDEAISEARILAEKANLEAEFICCDVLDLPMYFDGQFDIVFTSYGTIGWLPDINSWANVVNHFLKPGGNFVIAEFHPFVWMFDDDFSEIKYAYFNDEVIVEELEGTYTDGDMEALKSVSWNHTLSDVQTALMNQGLNIEKFQEYNYSPYDCFNGTKEIEKGKFIIKKLGNKVPMVYAIKAKK